MDDGKVKKNKSWQKHQFKGIPLGSVGVLISVEGNEKGAVREFYNLLDAFVESEKIAGKIYGSKNEVKEEDEEESVDASDELSAACAELKDKKSQKHDQSFIKPKQFSSNVKNLLYFQMPCSVDELYELGARFIEKCQNMRCCRYVARCVPFENVVAPDITALETAIGKVIERHFGLATDKKDTFNLEFKARCNDKINFEQVISIVNFHMKNFAPLAKVDLTKPDKSIVVQVIQKSVLVGCVNNFLELRRYSTKPKGTDDSSVTSEDQMRLKKEEDEKFADVTKFINEQRQKQKEKLEQQKKEKIMAQTSGNFEQKENTNPRFKKFKYEDDRSRPSHHSYNGSSVLQDQSLPADVFDRSVADVNLRQLGTSYEDFKANRIPTLGIPIQFNHPPPQSPRQMVNEGSDVFQGIETHDFETRFFNGVFRRPCFHRGGRQIQPSRDDINRTFPRTFDGRRTGGEQGIDHRRGNFDHSSRFESPNRQEVFGKAYVRDSRRPDTREFPPRPQKPPHYQPERIQDVISDSSVSVTPSIGPSSPPIESPVMGDGVVYFDKSAQGSQPSLLVREKKVLDIKTPPKALKKKYKTEREKAVEECINYIVDIVLTVHDE